MNITLQDQVDESAIALVLAAHGDRGGDMRNAGLAAHVRALSERGLYRIVTGGVLNGEPSLEDALAQAGQSGAAWILVYPVFMSAGYFAANILPQRIKAANLSVLTSILQPLGADSRAPLLMLENAVRSAKAAGFAPGETRLLTVGHGSKYGPANAESTRAAVRAIEPHSPFATIDVAFIEEAPFVTDVLREHNGRSVVAGFFSGDGMHAGGDVPDAIRESGAAAVYSGPVGLDPRVPDLIVSSVRRALKARAREHEPTPQGEHRESRGGERRPALRTFSRPADDRKVAARERDSSFLKSFSGGIGSMRFLFKAVFTLVMMAALGIAALIYLVPEDTIREQAQSFVKQQTGRDLTIGGGVSLALFPNIGVTLEDVKISNPPGMKPGHTLAVGALDVNLKLLPLLSRRVEVDRLVLNKPVFNLLVDAKGRKNWDIQNKTTLGPGGQPRAALPVPARRPAVIYAQAGGIGGGMVRDISLGSVKIDDGVLNYADERAGTKQRIDAINVSLVQPRLTEPLDADGSVNWNGERISFTSRVNEVPALLRNAPSKARVKLSTAHGKGSFEGQVALGPVVTASGAVSGDTQSVRGLAGWLGNPLPPGGGFGPAAISGQLGFKGETVSLSKAKISLDGMNGTGQANVRLQGARPHITAALVLDKLDLNPYLQPGSPQAQAPRAVAPAPRPAINQQAPAPKPGEGQSLTDFIDKLNKTDGGQGPRSPQVRAWSQRAIDLAGLRAADADLKLTANAIYYQKIKTGESAVTASLKNGVLTADLTKLSLYSGSGTGRVTLNGARAVPAVAALFNLSAVSALPLLRDAAEFDWVSGRANMAISLSGSGRSQSELVSGLQGQGQFAFADGAIEGINIPAMVRGLQQGQLDGWKRREREKTDFSQLSASFTVQQGVAYNKDLNLVGPLIRMTGEGNFDLGRERIDYAALPRIVASLQGQGATDDKKGLAVPVRITGPWAKPKIVPDLERLLRDPELTKDTIEKLSKSKKVGKVLDKLKNKEKVNELLQGVLGGGNQGDPNAPQQGEQGEKVRPEDILRNLLR